MLTLRCCIQGRREVGPPARKVASERPFELEGPSCEIGVGGWGGSHDNGDPHWETDREW